jgi:hypothetical protein
MFETRQDAEQAIGRYIDGFYNPVRRHSALDFTSPAQFERMAANSSNASPLGRSKSNSCRGERRASLAALGLVQGDADRSLVRPLRREARGGSR